MDSNDRSDAKEKAQSLTSVNGLQRMIMSKMDAKDHPSAPLACWYLGAISYRLAEARDLKIGWEYAVDLSNDQYLVKALLDNGFNSKSVIRGLARVVYDSPLSPDESFDSELMAC